jgi:hypothetical protein
MGVTLPNSAGIRRGSRTVTAMGDAQYPDRFGLNMAQRSVARRAPKQVFQATLNSALATARAIATVRALGSIGLVT